MKFIGCREHQRYTIEGLVIERTYLYRDASTFYEVTNGKVETFSYPRPFNLQPVLKGIQIDNILNPPDVELIPNIRYKERPLVHLVYGASGLGKSTLFMNHSCTYETDCSLVIEKECLWSSIIIIGNRSKFTPQTIIDFFNENELYPEFVLVEFKDS